MSATTLEILGIVFGVLGMLLCTYFVTQRWHKWKKDRSRNNFIITNQTRFFDRMVNKHFVSFIIWLVTLSFFAFLLMTITCVILLV